MSDEMKVGAAGNQGQQVGQVDGENYDKKKTEAEQQQFPAVCGISDVVFHNLFVRECLC